MIKIDLVTGFLGAGKTTFLKKYVSYLTAQKKRVGIIENDFGAINVDALLLQELQSDLCDVEQIVGGNEVTDWKRRFRAKLIAMAMQGFERIVVEPSGIYDVDAFFDVLYEEPLDRWYEAGTVFAIVDGRLERHLTKAERYLMVSQIANASEIIFSKTAGLHDEEIQETKNRLQDMLTEFKCDRKLEQNIVSKEWNLFTESDYERFTQHGWVRADHEKLWFDKNKVFDTLFFMNDAFPNADSLRDKIQRIFHTDSCGEVTRVKGFIPEKDGMWTTINVTREQYEEERGNFGQRVLIVIGQHLVEDEIRKILEK